MEQRHILFDFLFERVEFRGGKEFPEGDFKGVAELLDRNSSRILAFAVQYALDRALRNGGEVGQSVRRDAAFPAQRPNPGGDGFLGCHRPILQVICHYDRTGEV